MPLLIKTNRLSGLRPVFTDNLENYKRYIQIRKKFEGGNLYRIFAEPKLDHLRKEAEWYTEWEGQLFTFDAFLQAHPQIYREELESSIKAEVNKLFAECAKYRDTDAEYRALDLTLKQCIEIPAHNDIYILVLPSGEQKYILTNWGFITDAFDAKTGIIEKMQVMSLFNLKLKVQFTGGAAAANEKIYAEYNNKREEITTDANGEYIINRFPANTSLVLYQVDAAGKKANVNEFPLVDKDLIELSFKNLHLADHVFIIQDSTGKALPDKGILFRINGKDRTYGSDKDGKIAVVEIPDQSAVECYYYSGGKTHLVESFRSNLTQVTHIVRIPDGLLLIPEPAPAAVTQAPGEITLHFVDKKKADIPALPVTLRYPDGSQRSETTNETGRFKIAAPPDGVRILLSATHEKIRWKGKFVSKTGIAEHLFILRKKSRWWLWLLLGLLGLALLLLAGYFIAGCVRNQADRTNRQLVVTVLDDVDGTPVENAEVTLECGSYTRILQTGSDGQVKADDVPGVTIQKPLIIKVRKKGYEDWSGDYKNCPDHEVVRLRKTDQPKPKPCQTAAIGQDIDGYDKTLEYNMGADQGAFQIDYFTDVEPDALYVYCGNEEVWSYEGSTGQFDTLSSTVRFHTRIIKVRVKGNSRWWYRINCPK